MGARPPPHFGDTPPPQKKKQQQQQTNMIFVLKTDSNPHNAHKHNTFLCSLTKENTPLCSTLPQCTTLDPKYSFISGLALEITTGHVQSVYATMILLIKWDDCIQDNNNNGLKTGVLCCRPI